MTGTTVTAIQAMSETTEAYDADCYNIQYRNHTCVPPHVWCGNFSCVCPPPQVSDGLGGCKTPPGPQLMTFYMYRSQSDQDFDLENINAANLAGELYYLHHEVVTWCPRHHNITRILRLKVTMKTTQAIFQYGVMRSSQFMPFMAINFCQCAGCNKFWDKWGYAPGCQHVTWPDVGSHYYPDGMWYSLPGSCM